MNQFAAVDLLKMLGITKINYTALGEIIIWVNHVYYIFEEVDTSEYISPEEFGVTVSQMLAKGM